MTVIGNDLIEKLMTGSISKEEFLSSFPGSVDSAFLGRELKAVGSTKNPNSLEELMYLGFAFDLFRVEHIDLLIGLLVEGWHISHEDIVGLLQRFPAQKNIRPLVETVNSRFDYLEYNDSMALAVKCVWALFAIGSDEAKGYLGSIAAHDRREEVRGKAAERLKAWS